MRRDGCTRGCSYGNKSLVRWVSPLHWCARDVHEDSPRRPSRRPSRPTKTPRSRRPQDRRLIVDESKAFGNGNGKGKRDDSRDRICEKLPLSPTGVLFRAFVPVEQRNQGSRRLSLEVSRKRFLSSFQCCCCRCARRDRVIKINYFFSSIRRIVQYFHSS